MEKTKDTSPPTAKPVGISLYEPQRKFLERKAEELTQQTSRPVSASKVVQTLIEEAMKKEQGKP